MKKEDPEAQTNQMTANYNDLPNSCSLIDYSLNQPRGQKTELNNQWEGAKLMFKLSSYAY